MNKRGQLTLFAIIGIIIIILILLFLFLRSRIDLGPIAPQNLEGQFAQIKEHIQKCLVEISEPRIRQIGLQGGFIEIPTDTFRLYNNNKVSYLCYNIQDKPYCRSRILTAQDMEKELSETILHDLQTQCLNIRAFDKQGYELSQGKLTIQTSIRNDNVLIEANFPISIRKGEAVAEQSEFSSLIELPLGRLFEASRDIVNAEALAGDFDTVPYSLAKTQLTGKPHIVQKLQPYPDKLYLLKLSDVPKDNEYIFQFFIRGEPR